MVHRLCRSFDSVQESAYSHPLPPSDLFKPALLKLRDGDREVKYVLFVLDGVQLDPPAADVMPAVIQPSRLYAVLLRLPAQPRLVLHGQQLGSSNTA